MNSKARDTRHPRQMWESSLPSSLLFLKTGSHSRIAAEGSFLRSLSEFRSASRILDTGVGDGTLVKHYIKDNQLVIGVDYSMPMLQQARKQLAGLPCAFVCLDISKGLPFFSSADTVLVARTLHHFSKQEVIAALGRIRRSVSSSHNMVLVERWAFKPASRVTWALREARLEIAQAMFPGLGEFHHTNDFYKEALETAGYRDILHLKHWRSVSIQEYEQRMVDLGISSGEAVRDLKGLRGRDQVTLESTVLVSEGNA